jgi:hypothetical protein
MDLRHKVAGRMQKGTLCMRLLLMIRSGTNTLSHLCELHQLHRLSLVLCNLGSQEHVNLWGRCIQCFCRSTTTEAGFLHLPRQSFQRLVDPSQKEPTYSRWACDPSSWGYARPPRITMSLGKACQQHPLQYSPHPNCPRTLHLLWHNTQQTCPLHATG